jgi:hypothetical protein
VKNTSRTETKSYDGFAIPLQPDTELGLAILIVEDEEGTTQPVAVAASINEAKELAQSDLAGRRRRIEQDSDPDLRPYCYKLWARGINGDYRLAWTVDAASL